MQAPGSEQIHDTIRQAASQAVRQKLDVHRRLEQRVAVQKNGQIVVDLVENLLTENEQNPPHVA